MIALPKAATCRARVAPLRARSSDQVGNMLPPPLSLRPVVGRQSSTVMFRRQSSVDSVDDDKENTTSTPTTPTKAGVQAVSHAAPARDMVDQVVHQMLMHAKVAKISSMLGKEEVGFDIAEPCSPGAGIA